MEDTVPLFLSLPDKDDDKTADQICFSSKYKDPFIPSEVSQLTLNYYVCTAPDVRQVRIIMSY